MYAKALSVWLLTLLAAFALGILRTAWLLPSLGSQAAHVWGTLAFLAVFVWLIWRTVTWMCPALDRRSLVRIGVFWVALTASFEFLFQHYVLGVPWSILLADYNVFEGRLWVLVLVTSLIGPAVLGGIKRGGADGT